VKKVQARVCGKQEEEKVRAKEPIYNAIASGATCRTDTGEMISRTGIVRGWWAKTRTDKMVMKGQQH
jgi:hypothetical protein